MQRENEMKLCVGVGNSIAYPDEAKRSRNEAAAAIRVAAVTDMQGPVYFYKDQGIYTLISHVDDTRVLDEYVGKLKNNYVELSEEQVLEIYKAAY